MLVDLDQWLFLTTVRTLWSLGEDFTKKSQKCVDSVSHIQAKFQVQSSYPNIFKCSHGESHVQAQLKATGLYTPRDMASVITAESKARVWG